MLSRDHHYSTPFVPVMAHPSSDIANSGAEDFAPAPQHNDAMAAEAEQPQDISANSQKGNTQIDSGSRGDMHRSNSTMSQSHTLTPSRGGTLKKKRSLSKKGSVKRAGSRRSSYAGSITGLEATGQQFDGANDEQTNDAFFTPVPTTGSPTEILANRFQAWRKVLKDLITYFRDVQKSYESRSKSLVTLSNVINNTSMPPAFLTEGGIGDAIHVLRDYHKQAIGEGNKAKAIEDDVIVQLTGLRSDLQQKIKEIKSLSGDFKNNVDRETEGTRRAVRDLQEALAAVDDDPNQTHGKDDPYIGEYLPYPVPRRADLGLQAFLNLESSGRELESIVMGEIQKAYNAFAGILKREADEAYDTADRLRSGPVALAKDREWDAFVENNEHFVDPRLPVRRIQNITYPGKDHPAASEVRSGMLERKSKYLKSYTPGWYVLTPTHMHEFKSPDRILSQVPVMSLQLAEQKLGSHSGTDSTSHKFMLKGRQSGGMHRGHSWVFRAESYDTMLAWFEGLKVLTEKSGEERKAFIRRHARSLSSGSQKPPSLSSEGMEEDEADQVPFSSAASQVDQTQPREELPERPKPGGRFPSALNIDRSSQVPLSPSSPSSSDDRDAVAAAGALPGSNVPFGASAQGAASAGDEMHFRGLGGASDSNTQPATFVPSDSRSQAQYVPAAQGPISPVPGEVAFGPGNLSPQGPTPVPRNRSFPEQIERHDSKYGDWMGPATGGAAVGAAGAMAYKKREQNKQQLSQNPQSSVSPVLPEPAASTSNERGVANVSQAPPTQSSATAEVAPSSPPISEQQPIVAAPMPGAEYSNNPVEAQGVSSDSPGAVAYGGLSGPASQQAAHQQPQAGQDSFVPISQQREYNGLPVHEGPSPTSMFSSAGSTLADPAAPVKALADDPNFVAPRRPTLETQPSVATISELHVPGEFPPTLPVSGASST
ncbi:MAG: hypothetical protein Q9174_003290 [Haloplaca sp. 1 TL-2023]